MHEILQTPRRSVVLLVLLATVSYFSGDFIVLGLLSGGGVFWQLQLAAAGIAITAVMLLVLYALSWLAVAFGRLWKGNGSAADVRAAVAWGLTPFIWAIFYRLPDSIFDRYAEGFMRDYHNEGRVDDTIVGLLFYSPVVTAVHSSLTMLIFAWYVVVASNTLAAAHGISAGKGLATLSLTFGTALLVLIAVAQATWA